jgi:hypothetical protein
MNPRVRVRSLEEAEVHIASLNARIGHLENRVTDHTKRFDTLQTWFWKRVWFAIDGWPWHDLNGRQRPRPWHRRRAER